GARQATARARRVKKARRQAGRGGNVIRPRDKKSKSGEIPGDLYENRQKTFVVKNDLTTGRRTT
ncbi:MAG: hypothetical protein J5958_05555, partial [Clostridia bacterium]|nr:hypothetical protein [Clostridia bacterium]